MYRAEVSDLLHYAETADEAALLQALQKQRPVDTLLEYASQNQLPHQAGVYILVYTLGNKMQVSIQNKHPLRVSLNTHKGHKRLYVFKDSGQQLLKEAQVYHNGQTLKYLPEEKAFKIWSPFRVNGRLLIVHEGVPTWVNWRERYRYNRTVFDKLRRWYYDNIYRIERLFSKNKEFDKKRPYQQNVSYLAINKPMYRLGDTLQLKTFLLKKNKRPFEEPVQLEIAFYNPTLSQYQKRTVDTLYAYRPGAFSYKWRLPDSLLGKNVTLNLRNAKDQLLQTTQFLVQDYTLNQVIFKAELLGPEDKFHPNVPLKLSYKAQDDLGLSPMQGLINVQVKVGYINEAPKKPVVILPNVLLDTLFPLDPTGKGIFKLPTQNLPPFQTQLAIRISYQAANGERHEETFNRNWQPQPKAVHLRQNSKGLWVLQADSLFQGNEQNYYLQGAALSREVYPYLPSDRYGAKTKIALPYTFKTGLPQQWQLSMGDSVLLNNRTDGLEQTQYFWTIRKDSVLYYAEQQGQASPVVKVMANGKKLLYTGLLKDTLRLPTHYRYLQVVHLNPQDNYAAHTDFIPLTFRLKKAGSPRLNLQATGPQRIFPGDSASWQLQLTEEQAPVANYDILAMGYKEEQFSNTMAGIEQKVLNSRVHQPKYKLPTGPQFFREEAELIGPNESALISKAWRTQLGADSLDAFKYMFPKEGLVCHYQPLASPTEIAQFATFVYRGGKQYSVRYFSLNKRPLYIKDLSPWGYSAQAKPGKQTLTIRLERYKITVPQVALKRGYKANLVLDLDHLPDSVKTEEVPYNYTEEELEFLAPFVARFYLPKNAIISQGYQRKIWRYSGWQWLGPLAQDQFKISTAQGDTFRLIFKGGMSYKFDEENRILSYEANLEGTKQALKPRYYSREIQQWPGYQIKKPRPQPKLKSHEIEIAVHPLPTKGEAEECFMLVIPSSQSYAFFLHHLSTGRLFKLNPSALSRYANLNWPSGLYQVYTLNEKIVLVSDTFYLMPKNTAYINFSRMHSLSIPKALAQLQNITAASKGPLNESKISLSQNQGLGQWENSDKLEEVTISYSVPLIDATKTSKITTASDIQSMAVRDVTSVSDQAAGVSGSVRGARGEGSVYFIDGIKVRGAVNIPQAGISYASVVTDESESASALSQTESQLNTLAARGGGLRSNFKDYAFFIPDVTTNTQGQAQVKVQYPDDKANWTTYFVGMGRGNTYALTQTNTLAYSPVSANLATPRYLHKGDSCIIVGKTLNYLDTAFSLQTYFTQNGDTLRKSQNEVDNALVEYLPLKAEDSLALTYTLSLPNGFTDGEKRSIPILANGLTRQEGRFLSLKGDTNQVLTFDSTLLLQVGLMQSTTQFLLEEVALQMSYAHYCNEQMASKLKAILALNTINVAANRKEDQQREAKKLIKKLLANRNSESLWGWWGKQETNPFMTAHVLQSLVQAQAAGYNIDVPASITQATALLPQLNYAQAVDLLYVFSQNNIEAPYRYYLGKKVPSKLAHSTRFKAALIALKQGLIYDTLATEARVETTLLDHQYLPKDGAYSLEGDLSNTLLAYHYFKKTRQSERSQACLNYLLVGRNGSKINTLERAALIEALSLSADADTASVSLAYQVDNGPVQPVASNQKSFTVKGQTMRWIKKGLGPAFVSVTTSQHFPNPAADSTHFKVKSSWEKSPQVGEIASLNIEIEPNQSAEYLMIEIPLPAGCTVAQQGPAFKSPGVYSEVRGDKVYLYLRKMEGRFNYQLPLLARYAGAFNLNPIKIELMYFPSFSGNNKLQKINVAAAAKQ